MIRLSFVIPALLTRISIFPKSFFAASTELWTSAGSETLVLIGEALTPSPFISSAVFFASSRFMSDTGLMHQNHLKKAWTGLKAKTLLKRNNFFEHIRTQKEYKILTLSRYFLKVKIL